MGNKTGKLIIKVIYISFAVIIMFFSAIVLFNTAKGDHILNITNKALNEKNYDKILELFGGIYWNEPVKKETKGDTDLLVVPSYTESTILYYPADDSITHMHHVFDRTYNFYIFNSGFKVLDRSIKGEKINESGVKFITDKLDDQNNNVTYTYYFRVSATVNFNDSYEKALSVSDYNLNHQRDIISDQSKYSFYNFTISKELIDAIEEKTEGQITSFNITDNEGNDVFDSNINFGFEFNEEFYNEDQGGVIEAAYTRYIPYYDSIKINQKRYKTDHYDSSITKEVYNNETKVFNDTVSKFRSDVKDGNTYNSNLKISLGEKEIMTNSVIAQAVWRTIGIEALVLLVVAVIYILLFHFQQLRDFIFRNEKRTPIRAKVVNKEPEQKQNSFKYNQTGNKKNDQAKLEKPVEEAQPSKENVDTTEDSKEDSKEEPKNE